MATTTFTTMIPTPQPKKPGPPVPPRPQQSSLFNKQQQRDVSSSSATTAAPATQRLMNKVGLEQTQILKKPATTSSSLVSTSVTTSGGRTVIYKSPSLNLQKRQEEREKRNEVSTQTTTTAITRTTSAAASTTAATAAVAKAKLTNGMQAPKPPLKLRKAPDVPTNFKPRVTTPAQQPAEIKENSSQAKDNDAGNNIVIVQSSQGVVTLNRHHSMGSASPQNKTSALSKDTRLSLGRADFERVGKIQVQQLQPTSQPLPKPRKIVKVPVATLDVEDTMSTTSTSTSSTSSNTLHVNSLFKRSKTSIENFTSRSNITTVSTGTTGSYLSGKTVEIKNNLKNAAERLFSEIMVNQQKHNSLDSNMVTNTIITKHERAIQHQAEPQMMLNNANANNSNNVTVVTTSKDYATNQESNNCTRININGNIHQTRQVVSAFNSPEKKSAAFHEMLISELAAMRTRSCSMENLQTTKPLLQPPQSPSQSVKESVDKQYQNFNNKQFKSLENQLKTIGNKQPQQDIQQTQKSLAPAAPLTPSNHTNANSNNKLQHQQQPAETTDDDIDADNIEDADGDIEEDLKKSLKVIATQNSPRKRTPSGCSSDSSPYGTDRSARIRTSDWIEVGDNGKQVTLTSCHISLEDSGLEDEERMDEMSSSGVGDSWDSVKEAEQQQQQLQQQQQAKRNRTVKRIMSINDLPPLPKSLSGINKMLASDSGLVSDVDTEIKNCKNNELKEYENQKENNNNLNINNNTTTNNNNNNNNNNSIKDATSDKLNNVSSTITTNNTSATITTTTSLSSSTTPLKEINGNETISEIPPAIPGSKLDTQIATLRKEMFGLRQLDLSLLSQLWALNDSIQEFRTMIQEQEQDDDETYSTHSRSPSPYDSVSSDAEDEILTLKSKNRMELQNGNVITTQPKLSMKSSCNGDNDVTTSSHSTPSMTTPSTISATLMDQQQQQQRSQLLKPPLPKPLDVKPVPRMRSAPPPPPTHRKSQSAPPRPT